MSVLIKGMGMPECCDVCMFSDWSNLNQTASCKLKEYEPCFANFSVEYRSKRADFCPLVALPDKHGRLVDADTLIKFIDNRYNITWKDDYEGGIKDACTDILEEINKMPTIEPRKKGKWINIREGNRADCDQCGQSGRAWMNFCFDCGADMR